MDIGWRPPPKLVNLQEKVDRGTRGKVALTRVT